MSALSPHVFSASTSPRPSVGALRRAGFCRAIIVAVALLAASVGGGCSGSEEEVSSSEGDQAVGVWPTPEFRCGEGLVTYRVATADDPGAVGIRCVAFTHGSTGTAIVWYGEGALSNGETYRHLGEGLGNNADADAATTISYAGATYGLFGADEMASLRNVSADIKATAQADQTARTQVKGLTINAEFGVILPSATPDTGSNPTSVPGVVRPADLLRDTVPGRLVLSTTDEVGNVVPRETWTRLDLLGAQTPAYISSISTPVDYCNAGLNSYIARRGTFDIGLRCELPDGLGWYGDGEVVSKNYLRLGVNDVPTLAAGTSAYANAEGAAASGHVAIFQMARDASYGAISAVVPRNRILFVRREGSCSSASKSIQSLGRTSFSIEDRWESRSADLLWSGNRSSVPEGC